MSYVGRRRSQFHSHKQTRLPKAFIQMPAQLRARNEVTLPAVHNVGVADMSLLMLRYCDNWVPSVLDYVIVITIWSSSQSED